VVGARDDAGDRRLIGYVVVDPQPGAGFNRELRDFLKNEVAGLHGPAEFVFLEALPLTPSGKINRRALRPRT